MTRTDAPSTQARPVPLAVVLAILASFALFLLLTLWVAGSHPTVPAYGSADGVPKEAAWQATAAGRRAYMLDLRAKQEKQGASYAWVDRKAGLVQVPIERAMALIAQENSRRK